MADAGTWLEWATRFREHVRDRKLRWAKVAEDAGVSEPTIRSWLNGHRKINLEDFFSLCGAVDADPVRILFGRPLFTKRLQDALEDQQRPAPASRPLRVTR